MRTQTHVLICIVILAMASKLPVVTCTPMQDLHVLTVQVLVGDSDRSAFEWSVEACRAHSMKAAL